MSHDGSDSEAEMLRVMGLAAPRAAPQPQPQRGADEDDEDALMVAYAGVAMPPSLPPQQQKQPPVPLSPAQQQPKRAPRRSRSRSRAPRAVVAAADTAAGADSDDDAPAPAPAPAPPRRARAAQHKRHADALVAAMDDEEALPIGPRARLAVGFAATSRSDGDSQTGAAPRARVRPGAESDVDEEEAGDNNNNDDDDDDAMLMIGADTPVVSPPSGVRPMAPAVPAPAGKRVRAPRAAAGARAPRARKSQAQQRRAHATETLTSAVYALPDQPPATETRRVAPVYVTAYGAPQPLPNFCGWMWVLLASFTIRFISRVLDCGHVPASGDAAARAHPLVPVVTPADANKFIFTNKTLVNEHRDAWRIWSIGVVQRIRSGTAPLPPYMQTSTDEAQQAAARTAWYTMLDAARRAMHESVCVGAGPRRAPGGSAHACTICGGTDVREPRDDVAIAWRPRLLCLPPLCTRHASVAEPLALGTCLSEYALAYAYAFLAQQPVRDRASVDTAATIVAHTAQLHELFLHMERLATDLGVHMLTRPAIVSPVYVTQPGRVADVVQAQSAEM